MGKRVGLGRKYRGKESVRAGRPGDHVVVQVLARAPCQRGEVGDGRLATGPNHGPPPTF